MKKIRTIIVDDEPLARDGVRLLSEQDAQIEIVAVCATGREAVKAVASHAPDLLFLDVQMPEMSGFETLAQLAGRRPPVIIFVTAYDAYAIRAFEAQALDYILKPFSDERFHKALARAKSYIKKERTHVIHRRLFSLLNDYAKQQIMDDADPSPGGDSSDASFPSDRLTITINGRIVPLKMTDIDWMEAEDNYVRIHVGKTSYLMREPLSRLEARLDPKIFLRIHRSTIVNIDRVRELQPLFHGERRVILRDGTTLTLSRRYRDKAAKSLGKI